MLQPSTATYPVELQEQPFSQGRAGNDSGALGKYVGFHPYRGGVGGETDGLKKYYFGVLRNPTEPILATSATCRNRDTDFVVGIPPS